MAREVVESILDDPRPVPTACDADSADRYPLAYTVRLEWLHVQYDGDDEPLCGWVARNYTTMP